MRKILSIVALAVVTMGIAMAEVHVTIDAAQVNDSVTRVGYITDWTAVSEIWADPETHTIRESARAILGKMPRDGRSRISDCRLRICPTGKVEQKRSSYFSAEMQDFRDNYVTILCSMRPVEL